MKAKLKLIFLVLFTFSSYFLYAEEMKGSEAMISEK
jgi:hypothetical protein